MEIISQNYEKLLEKCILDNFSKIINRETNVNLNQNKVFNYINILDTLDSKICEIALKSLNSVFYSLDRGFRNSPDRKHKYHIKANNKRTIMTIFGELTYSKTIYENKFTHQSYCFIDDYLGLAKYDYFDPYIKAAILDYSSKYPYSQVATIMNDLINNRIKLKEPFKIISRQTVRNIILHSKLSNPERMELNTPEDLYIMADEKFIHTQNNNHKDIMVKSIVVFEGRETDKDGKVKLKNKKIFADDKSNCVEKSLDYIFYTYDVDKIKNVYVMGDGAKWIKNITTHYKFNQNINVTFNLDNFHFKQALHHIALDNVLEKYLLDYIINNNKKDFVECCDSLIHSHPHRADTIIQKKDYILNNWKYILNLYKNHLKCPMESQISHNIAALFSSRPKAYSKKTLDKLLNLRLLNKNQNNIKLLYLNNINKKDILEYNQACLNYSIFEKNQETGIDKTMIPENYHPGYHHDNTFALEMLRFIKNI